MTPNDISQITRAIAEALTPIAQEAARSHAEAVLGRLLDIDDAGLRDRVDGVVSALIRKKVKRTLWIEVESRPWRKR